MQGWRQPQPSGTNRPSSYPSHPRGRSFMCLAGATQQGRSGYPVRRARCAAPRARGNHPFTWEASSSSSTSAAHRSAAMAGGARPDPFRTRKLSRRAPMVLRGQPVGEQGAADRWTALDPYAAGSGAGGAAGASPPRRPLPFSPYRPAEGPPGPFFHAAGAREPAAWTAFPRPAIPVPRNQEGTRAGLSRSAVYTPLTSCPATLPAVRLLPPANTLLEFRLGLPRALPAWGRGRAHIQALQACCT